MINLTSIILSILITHIHIDVTIFDDETLYPSAISKNTAHTKKHKVFSKHLLSNTF